MEAIERILDVNAALRRMRNGWRTMVARGDIPTLVIACLLVLIPVMGLNAGLGDFTRQASPRVVTTWPISLSQLIPVAVLSVIFGFALARSHYSEGLALLLSGIYSIGITLLIQIFAAPGNLIQRVIAVAIRLSYAISATLSGSVDPFFLIIFLSLLVWFLGHNTAWHIFRLDRIWRAILPPAVVLVLNNFFNAALNLDYYLITFLFLALLLVVRSHIEAREYDWYINRIRFQGNLRDWFFRGGALLGVLMLVFAWNLPTGSAIENQKKFSDFLNGDLARRVQDLMNRLLSPIEGPGAVTTDYYGGDTLKLGGAIKLGNDPVMYITVDKQVQRFYWKSRTFDTYDKGSWTAYRGLRVNADNLNFQYPTLDPATRTTVTQSVTMAIGSSRLVYTAPQPAEVRLPAQVEMDFLGDPRTADVGVIRPQQPIPEAAPYEVVSTVSTPTVAQLEADEGPYPTWIQRDLDLPNTVTNRTRGRAQDILRAANAVTRYEKARAIEIWLRSNIKYSESISLPPQNQDPVDWLLFDKKEGYCTYYASAMVVMLRTVGVPARIAAGFAQGQNEPGTQVYTVRERDAHTWVEVYFPKAGWVEFEPTSAQMPLDRPPPRVEPRTPSPSPTFTPSATPTFTPTPTTANGQTNRPPPTAQPTVTPTVLPTATPTLAPSPVVSAPPSPPILSRVVRNFLWVVLILLGAIAVLSVVGVGLLWWVEYRGLDRLSPAARGYARLAIYARWLRIPIDDSNTPMERGRRIAKEVPTGNRPVNTLTDLYIAERYAPPGRTGKKPIEEEQRIQSLWRAARRAFLQSKFRRWFHRE